MKTDRELMQMALDALEGVPIEYDFHGNPMDEDAKKVKPAIEALCDRLAQPEPEPVKYAATKSPMIPDNMFSTNASVYTAPPSIEAAVKAEREACAAVAAVALLGCERSIGERVVRAIRARREK